MDIDDDDLLLRRLAPAHLTGEDVNSLAYSGKSHEPYEISVDLLRLTTLDAALATRPTFGLGVLIVRDVRGVGLRVVHDPIDGNDAHCLIVGDYSKAVARSLARMTRVVRKPSIDLRP